MHDQSSVVFIVILIIVLIILIWAAWSASNTNGGWNGKKSFFRPTDRSFKQTMAQLWNQHVALTRLVVTDAADNAPCLQSDIELLNQNQRDLGDNLAIKLGNSAGRQYANLLLDHISGAIKIVTLALQSKKIDAAVKAWYQNKDDIIDFLAKEVKSFDKKKLNKHWTEHLDITLKEATAIIKHDCSASSDAYLEAVNDANMMSDYMADTILKHDDSVHLTAAMED